MAPSDGDVSSEESSKYWMEGEGVAGCYDLSSLVGTVSSASDDVVQEDEESQKPDDEDQFAFVQCEANSDVCLVGPTDENYTEHRQRCILSPKSR